ncbi:MAG: hypothetical protein AVDCRST_MAG77-1108 [uncultured Chloroflexi bacterium]|uniref:Uncharacterized protein n=1 Tax=uncultured Chloroflexota bacterium TaxID=166587 RepID=A0A6J4HUJ6_9CHLR|nr:MAG: hypothetical protein AVDCRST_MAG77-1108 [uncultured Chloroflexota bacterium]
MGMGHLTHAAPDDRLRRACTACGAPFERPRARRVVLCRLCAAKRSIQTQYDYKWVPGGGEQPEGPS